MRIDVVKEIDKHNKETWMFNVFNLNQIVFVGFLLEEKPLKKRVWRIKKQWSVYSRSLSDNSLKEPILMEDIKDEAIKKAQSLIKVISWNEFKN